MTVAVPNAVIGPVIKYEGMNWHKKVINYAGYTHNLNSDIAPPDFNDGVQH